MLGPVVVDDGLRRRVAVDGVGEAGTGERSARVVGLCPALVGRTGQVRLETVRHGLAGDVEVPAPGAV